MKFDENKIIFFFIHLAPILFKCFEASKVFSTLGMLHNCGEEMEVKHGKP